MFVDAYMCRPEQNAPYGAPKREATSDTESDTDMDSASEYRAASASEDEEDEEENERYTRPATHRFHASAHAKPTGAPRSRASRRSRSRLCSSSLAGYIRCAAARRRRWSCSS
jgi:hypothetical protein